MKNFIEVHTNYQHEDSKVQLINVAHIVRVTTFDDKTYIEVTPISGDSENFSSDQVAIMESYDEVKRAIIMAQSN